MKVSYPFQCGGFKFMLYFELMIFFILSHLYGNTQDTIFVPSSECPNYNTFTDNSNILSNPHFIGSFQNGTYYLDLLDFDSLDMILNSFELDSNISFQFQFSDFEFKDSTLYYSRYQQLYKGIPVDGGGFTAEYIRFGNGDPGNPCDKILNISPRIYTDISLNTIPTIPLSTAISTLEMDTMVHSDLIILHNLFNDCEYHLSWVISYFNNGNRKAYLDAHTGLILNVVIADNFLEAPTLDYGTVTLNEYKSGNTSYLQSPDRRIKILDLDDGATSIPPSPVFEDSYSHHWKNRFSPLSTSQTVWTNESTELAYQAMYMTDKVLPEFDLLGIGKGFTDLRVGTWIPFTSGKAMNWLNSPFQSILLGGNLNGGTAALPDFIAHELTHIYLRKFVTT